MVTLVGVPPPHDAFKCGYMYRENRSNAANSTPIGFAHPPKEPRFSRFRDLNSVSATNETPKYHSARHKVSNSCLKNETNGFTRYSNVKRTEAVTKTHSGSLEEAGAVTATKDNQTTAAAIQP